LVFRQIREKWSLVVGMTCSLLLAGTAMSPGLTHAGVIEKLFAPRAKLWPIWEEHHPGFDLDIDNGAWSSFLETYVTPGPDNINRVDYKGVSATDRASLKSYIATLSETPISGSSRNHQLAYWINLYNALTVDIVLDHYPVESIRDIKLSRGLFSTGPWNKKLLLIEGEKVSLNDIEHRILRPIWKGPRIHYALNCASVGCPNLMEKPFTAHNTEAMLEQGARDYINHPRGARVTNGRLHVSSIYSWFESDFGGSTVGVINHLKQYADESLAEELAGVQTISGDGYDWTLNDLLD
jgi:hypothetical protein